MLVHSTLKVEDRMAIFVSFHRHGDEHGHVSQLAKEWKVSRRFIYRLAAKVRAALMPVHAGRKAIDSAAETVAALQAFAPRYVVPGHCTGWYATQQIAHAMPEAYIPNSVGTTFML